MTRRSSAGGLDAQLERVVPNAGARAFLLVARGDRPGRVFTLTHDTMLVGRGTEADVQLQDPSVSSQHARIVNGATGFEIEDLQSRNGTFVNGRRVGRLRLSNGDRVRLGHVELAFMLDGAQESTLALGPATAMPTLTLAPVGPPGALVPRGRDDEEGVSVQEMVRRGVRAYQFLRRHWYMATMLVSAGAFLGLVSLVVVPPASRARCQVKLHTEAKSNPVEPTTIPQPEAMQFFLGAERTFSAPTLVAKTLASLGDKRASEDELEAIGKRLKFESIDDKLYEATYKDGLFDRSPHSPEKLLARHVKTYVDHEVDKKMKVFGAETDFLRSQLKGVERDLAKINAELVAFREANADRLQDQGLEVASQSRLQLETRRAELTAQVRRLEGELASERRQLTGGTPLASSLAYRDQLATIQRKLAEARARGLAELHPDVRQLEAERRTIEGLIDGQMRSGSAAGSSFERRSNVAYHEIENRMALLRAQLAAARSESSDLERALQRFRRAATDLPKLDARLGELKQLQASTQALHSQLFDRLKKAELQLALERVSVASRYEVLAAPKLERAGVVKSLVVRMFLGFLLGALVAAAVIGFFELRRLVRRTLEETEAHAEARLARP